MASRHELVGRGHPARRARRPRPRASRPRPWAPGPRSSAYPSSSPSTRATPSSRTTLRALAPDCCPVVAYGALLPQSALDIPAHGWVNLHFSVLPAWRGAAPGPARAVGGRRGHRRHDVPDRARARRRADVRPDDRTRPPGRHRRRPARAARRGRRRPARRHPRRHRGRLDRGPPAARGRRQLRPQDHRRGRPRRLDRARDGRRPPDPRVHAGARAPGRRSRASG